MASIAFGPIVTEAQVGRDLLGILLDAGAPITYICMSGSCGTCQVHIDSGSEFLGPITSSERMHLGAKAGPCRLACQATCRGGGNVIVSQ